MTTLPEQLRAEVAQRIVTGRPWPASSLMIEASDEIERLHALTEGDPTSIYAETADLRAWKESAMSVLAEWDRVHDALGRPGPLGRSLALNTLAEVERLSAENERLREALDKVLKRMTERGSIGGVDSHVRTSWFSVAEADRLHAALTAPSPVERVEPHESPRGEQTEDGLGHPRWSDGPPILIGDRVLVDEIEGEDEYGHPEVVRGAAGHVFSVDPETVTIVGLWADDDEPWEASPHELTRRTAAPSPSTGEDGGYG